MRRLKVNPWVIISLVLATVLIASLVVNAREINLFQSKIVAVTPVSASEIYPIFLCPCCGKPLDKNNICCEMAKERVDYIDSLAVAGTSQDEIILAYIKKYGLNSFIDKNKAEEFKQKLAEQAPKERPVITLNPASFDFGEVSQAKGIMTTSFEIKNEGSDDLIIDRLETSCGCTSASIVFRGKEGPKFSMPGHGINEEIKEGKVIIPSGEKEELKVYYDPNVHRDFRGPATREISVFSNDPIDFEKKVLIELNQVD